MKVRNLLRFLGVFMISIFVILSFTGCSSNYNNIDKLAYVVALGLDVGENHTLKLSFQISIPQSTDSKSGSSQSSDVIVNSVECSSISSGINLMNSYISKKINLSHCKVVVFSEQLAYQGLSEYIYTLVNDINISPSTNIIISKSNAKAFLENAKPTTESLSARYYEIAPTSSEYTGYTANVKIGTFFSNILDTFSEPFAILGSVNNEQTHNNHSNNSVNQDSSYTAGETPLETSKTNIENMGLAVFSKDKMVGELNGMETICHLIVTNELDTCIITIPSPFSSQETIDLQLKMDKSTKKDLELVGSSPFITVKAHLKATILSMNENHNYLEEENLNLLENYANAYLERNISQYLYKTAKELKSDISGFGKYMVSHFLTWDDWINSNWTATFPNSFFSVEVQTNIRSAHLLLKT